MTEKRFSYEEVNFCNDNLTGNQFDLTNPNEMLDLLNSLADESKQLKEWNQELYDKLQETMSAYSLKMGETELIKHIIKEAYETERTAIGKNVLKQLLNNIGETNE